MSTTKNAWLRRPLRSWVLLAGLAGCAATRAPARAAGPAKTTTATAKPARLKLHDRLAPLFARGDLKAAAAAVAAARQLPDGTRPSATQLAYWEAAVHSYARDYRGAATVLARYLATLPRDDDTVFWLHNQSIAMNTAAGDLLSAIAECEEMTNSGLRGHWDDTPDAERLRHVHLKEHWHRAYLWRMAAQTRTGDARATLIRYAEQARRDYAALAAPLGGGLLDSIAVLDAYFAFCDGDRAAMQTAAARVDLQRDDDVEDLYLVQLAFGGAGNAAAEAATRARMRQLVDANLMLPIFFDWMRADDAAASGAPAHFTPKTPSAPPPQSGAIS